jgi:hypothetical protein
LEKELLELNEHTAFFKALSLNTAVVDVLKLLKIGILEYFLDLAIDNLVKLL